MSCFEGDSRGWWGVYERSVGREEESTPLPRIRTKRTIPLREKTIRGTVVGPRLISSSLRGKSNYSSPYSDSFRCNTSHPFLFKSLNRRVEYPLNSSVNLLVNLVDIIRETFHASPLLRFFSSFLGKKPDKWKQVVQEVFSNRSG